MENKIAGNIAAVKYNPVTVVKKNESSHPSSDRKLTDDLKKKVKEKQLDMQNMLKFPGCSFILVLSDEVGESTKSCDCVLCFQSVQRTDLDGMIQHCKSKEHLLKVMELLNPDCADICSKKGTEHEILSILNCKSGDLDKDGVSFAPLSTFLSVRKTIFKRILTLRKKPVKAKEDWTKTNLRKTLTPVQSPKRTPSSLSPSSVSSSPKNIGDNDCVKDVRDSSIVEGTKVRKIISLKRKSCYDNQTSPHKPEKEICTPPKNIKLAAESVTNKSTVIIDSKDATETQKLKVKIEHIKDTANKKQVQTLNKSQILPKNHTQILIKTKGLHQNDTKLVPKAEDKSKNLHSIKKSEGVGKSTTMKSTSGTNKTVGKIAQNTGVQTIGKKPTLSTSQPHSKNLVLGKSKPSISDSKLGFKISAENLKSDKSNEIKGTKPKYKKIVLNQDSNDDVILDLKKKNIKISSLPSTKSSGLFKRNNSTMERKTSTNISNAKCSPVRIAKKNESSQPGSNPKVTHDDKGKKLEEKKKEIQKMLNIPGHSFILVLSDKIDEEKEVYDCVLCNQHSQRTNLEGIIQHCKSRDHLLKVMDLVNRKCAAFYSNKGTEFQIISVLKSRASELDKDGVTFAPHSNFFSVRVAIFKRILGLLKNPIKDKEDWTNIIPRESLTPIKSPESEPTHPCLSSKSLSSAKDIDSNANVTALSKSKPLSKNMPLVKSESSIPKSKIAVKNSAANSELEKSNGTMPKCEKIVGNEDPNDAILNLKKKTMKMSSLPNTKSLGSSQNNNSTMESKTSTNIGDAKCSPSTVKKNESSQPYFDPKVTDDIKGKTFEEKKLEITPGHSFILVLNEKIDEDKKAYDCVLCHKNTQRTSLEGIIQHCKSKDHMLKVMELVNPKYAEFYSQKGSVFEIIAVLKSRAGDLDKDGVSFAPTSTFLSVRRKITNRILKLRNELAKTSNEQAETSEAEDVKLKHRNIVFNEENEDNSEDVNSNVIFDLKKLNRFEKEIYEAYKKQIDELVELHRKRRPKKVIIVTDERDVFTQDEVHTNNYQYRIIKGVNLSFSNLKQYLVQDPDFGSGVLYVILCGINSINEEKINPACLKTQCNSPSKFLDETNYEVDLIRRALYIHRVILKFNQKDTAIFSGLLPSSPNYFNSVSYDQRKCSGIHEAAPPPPSQCTRKYDIKKLHLYNTFTNFHSKLFGFIPLKLDVGFSVKFSKKLNTQRMNFNFATLKNGYHFADGFASRRKLAILKKCDKLQKKLLQSTNLDQNKEMLSKVDVNVNKDIKVDYTSQSKEATVVQATSSSQDENVNHRKETKHRSIPMTKTVIQPSKFMGTDSLNKPDCESKCEPATKPAASKATDSRISKYEKIVILGSSRNKYYLEHLQSPKVCIMSEDMSPEDLLAYIKDRETHMPHSTLWVLVAGIGFLFSKGVYEMCRNLNCIRPLQATQPTDKVASVSRAVSTFDEMRNVLSIIGSNVKKVLSLKSDFMLFPPIPPALIIESSVSHDNLHVLMSKHPKSHIVTEELASHFNNIFQKVSLSVALLTWEAINNMGISSDPLEKYLDCHLNQIDIIDSTVTSTPNKLPFFTEWLNTLKNVMSSCEGDSNSSETLNEKEGFMSSRVIIFSSDEDKDRGIAKTPAFSDKKPDGKSVFSSSNTNERQNEEIDPKRKYSVTGCKSTTAKEGDIVSSELKRKTSILKNVSNVSGSKLLSNITSKKSVRKPKLTSTNKLHQSSCEQSKMKQEFKIYKKADPKLFIAPLESNAKSKTLIACSESDAKIELFTAFSETDLKAEQEMESEIFDADEDLSNDNVDDLADYIFYSYSSEDEEELYGSNNSKDKESQKSNALEDCNLEQKVEKSLTDKQLPPLETLKEKKLDSTESTFIDSEEVNLVEHQPVSYPVSKESKVPFLDKSKCSLQKDTNIFSLGSVEVKRTEHRFEKIDVPGLDITKQPFKTKTNNSTLASGELNRTKHHVHHTLPEKVNVSNLEMIEQSIQIDIKNFSLVSTKVSDTECHAESKKLLEKTDISNLEVTEQSLEIDSNSSSSALVEMNRTEHQGVYQTLSEKTASNIEVTKQSLQIDTNNLSEDSKKVDKKDLPVVTLSKNKDSKESRLKYSNTTKPDKQLASDFIHKIGKLNSTIKTVSNSVTEERKSNNFESISSTNSPDRHKNNDNYTETLKNQRLSDRKRDRRVYGPIIFIANSEIKKYLQSVEEFKSYSFWDLEYPINWVQVEENILDLSTGQSYLFIIAEDITLVTCDSPMTECFNETCKEPIILHKLDSSKSVLTERLNALKIIHEKLKDVPNINTKVILAPFFPRLCFDIRKIGGLSSHSSLHTDVDNKLRPCFIDGNVDYVNAKALELKGMWFNIVQSLNCAKDLTKKLSDEMFFFLRSYNLVKWIFDSVIRFPCRFQSLWAEKLVIVIDFYIQTYLNGSKSIKIGKLNSKSLNFDSNSEGNNVSDRNNVVISAQKKIEYSNLSNLSSSNQNKEVLEDEKNKSDCEELFISEELEREILGADDDEFEEPATENKTLKDNYGGGVCDLVTASKNANLTTMAEDLNYDQKVCTHGNKIVEVILNTNLMNTNANLQEKGNIYEFDMVEVKKRKESEKIENESSVMVENAVNEEPSKLDSTSFVLENVEEKDDNVLGSNYFVCKLVASENQEDGNNGANKNKLYVPNIEVNAKSSLDECEYEKVLVNKQEQRFNNNEMENNVTKVINNENNVTKEKKNLFGEFDDRENNSCENISEENENFEFSAMNKTFDKKETFVIGSRSGQLIQSKESFHKNLLQPIGDKSSNLSEVINIKDYTKTKDSASPSCIKYGNQNQTENSIAATNSDIITRGRNSEETCSVECGTNEKYKSKNSLDMICDYVDDNFAKEYAQPVSEIKDKNKVENKYENILNYIGKEYNMDDNFEEEYEHPVSEHEDKIKAESKNDNVLSYIKSEYKLLDVIANPCYVKEEILDDDIDLNLCNFKSKNNKLDLRNPNHEFDSIKEDSKGSVNMNINIDQAQEETSENKYHIDVSEDPSYLSNDVEVKNLINEDKILNDSREKDTVKENIVDEVIDKEANKFINKKDASQKLKRATTQETLCLMRKQELACSKKKKTLLFDNDVSEVGDEEKEKTVKDPVLKTIAGHCIAKTDTNESKEIQIPDYDVLSVPYAIRDCKVKSDSLIGENFEEKLYNSANNVMNNVTERLSNSSSLFSNSFINSVDPTVEQSRIDIESESYPRNANLIYITAKSNVEYKATVERSLKSESETKVENRQDHKFNVLNVENKNYKPVSSVLLADSEMREKQSSIITESERKTETVEEIKIGNIIPCYDHMYIIGRFNPLSPKNKKLLNYTFIKRGVSDLDEESAECFLEEKHPLVANSVCIFICDILDICKKYVEPKHKTPDSRENHFVIYDLKDSSSHPTEEGRVSINNLVSTFMKIVNKLKKKLPVVVMPLQPYILIAECGFTRSASVTNDDTLFVHGSSSKWIYYRDYFVRDWKRMFDTNDKNLSRSCMSFFEKNPSLIYPVVSKDLTEISEEKREWKWVECVNEVIVKLVKSPKKSVDSIKNVSDSIGKASKDKGREGYDIKICNLSDSIPFAFYNEISERAAGKKTLCQFEEGYVQITFDSRQIANLFVKYLNNFVIGDTVLKSKVINEDHKEVISDISKPIRKSFERSLEPYLEKWKFTASEMMKKNIQNILCCESFKTIRCQKSDCDETRCIFYHNEEDRRRNPYSIPYESGTCKNLSNGNCFNGDNCQYAHNSFESMFHPFEMYSKFCDAYSSRKECFLVNPLCPHAHLDSPEIFFTKYWNDSLLFGSPLAVEFLAGAIRKFNIYNPLYKDCRIFLMGASDKFLLNVWGAVNDICKTRYSFDFDFVGVRDLVFESEPLLFGTPSKFVENIDRLVLLPFTVIIVSQIDVLLSTEKERQALINFFARCKMFAPPYVQTLFVADEYDRNLQATIKLHFHKDVKIIKNPGHKVKFCYDVSYTPLTALPKWLDTAPNPTQVYSFLSEEVVITEGKEEKEHVRSRRGKKGKKTDRRGKKRKSSTSSNSRSNRNHSRSKSPNYKRQRSRSSSRSQSSSRCSSKKSVKRLRTRKSSSPPPGTSSTVVPEKNKSRVDVKETKDINKKILRKQSPSRHSPKRSIKRPRTRKSSSPSPGTSSTLVPEKKKDRADVKETKDISKKLIKSQSPSRRSSKKSIKRPRTRKSSCSPSAATTTLVPKKKKGRADVKETKDVSKKLIKSQSPSRRSSKESVKRKRTRKSSSPPPGTSSTLVHGVNVKRTKDTGNQSAPRQKSAEKDKPDSINKSPPSVLCDVNDQDIKPPPTPPIPFHPLSNVIKMNKLELERKEEPKKSDPSLDRIIHRTLLLEFATRSFNSTLLKKEIGDKLYEEFEAEKEKICFRLDDEFEVYKTRPYLYHKYKKCREEFVQMYKNKYPNYSEEQTELAWIEFWMSKFDFVEKTELQNRIGRLVERFRQKSKFFPPLPPPPPPPVISGLNLHFGSNNSDINMASSSKVSSPTVGQIISPPITFNPSSQPNYNTDYSSNENSSFQTSSFFSSSNNLMYRNLHPKVSESNADGRYTFRNTPPLCDDNSVSGIDPKHSLFKNISGKFQPPSDFEETERIVGKTSFPPSICSSVDSFKRKTSSPQRTHFSLFPISVDSSPSYNKALDKRFSSDLKNKNLYETSDIDSIPSCSFKTSFVTSGNTPNIDKPIEKHGLLSTSVMTSTRTKGDGEKMMVKESKESKISEDENSFEGLNMNKVIEDLGMMVPHIGALGSSMIKSLKEDGINSEKSLNIFTNPDYITLMELALNKIKKEHTGKRKEFYYSLKGTVKSLIKYSKQELERKQKERSVKGLVKYGEEKLKRNEKEEVLSINYQSIAKATVGKDTTFIYEMIRTAAAYEGIKLTKEQERETYMKICYLHFDLASNKM
ncbi:UNVERIFIED_CONTAM: hypothetical protein RMT77_014041 [Armadillidium vulgare]